jgi:hypothetical protein
MHIIPRALCASAALVALLPSPSRAERPSRVLEVEVDWSAANPEIDAEDALRRFRVGPQDTVTIRVRHFNFFSYRLEINTATRVDAAYTALSGIWERIIAAAALVPGVRLPVAGGFDEQLFFWKQSIDAVKDALAVFDDARYRRPKSFGPRSAELDALREASSTVPSSERSVPNLVRRMQGLRDKARSAIDTPEDQARFAAYDALHKEVEAAAGSFLDVVALIVNGKTTFVTTHEVGTVVTVTLRQISKEDESTLQTAAIDFHVLSPRRLLYHIGYEAARLKTFKFKEVANLTGADLYNLDSTSTSAVGLSAFMSAELKSWGPNQRYGLLATIGTGLQEPSKRFTAGVSLRTFARFVTTVGVHVQNVEKGADQVDDGGNTFRRLVSSAKLAPVIGFSVKVY